MKKFFVIAVTGLFLFSTASCGTGRAHCDAYGDATTTTVEHDDLAEN